MARSDVADYIRVSRALPQPTADGSEAEVRSGRYGEPIVALLSPTKHQLADEGSYFVYSNQAPGTTVQRQANVTAFANTNGIAHLFNTESASDSKAKRFYLDYVKLILAGTAPTATVSMEFALALDNVTREPAAANRALIPGKGVNMDVAVPSIMAASQYLNANAFTVVAPSTSVRYIRGHIPTGLGITGDEYILKCGGEDLAALGGLTAARAVVPGRMVGYCPPVVVGPGQSLVIHQWWLSAATTAETYELEIGGWER